VEVSLLLEVEEGYGEEEEQCDKDFQDEVHLLYR
jgi:hypothetical protein